MADPFAAVRGQDRAVASLRAAVAAPVHAYLFVGPPGTGRRAAARAFAAALLCPDRGCGDCDVCRRVESGVHPDVVVRERAGASLLVDEARELARLAARSPTEGARKVLVVPDFHLVEEAAPALLKTIEEPPASAVFVLIADQVTPELVTIASRCVRIDFAPLPADVVAAALVDEGVEASMAAEVAGLAGGRLDRARRLASDASFAERQARWRSIPSRLDGRGMTVVTLAEELVADLDAALTPVREAQAAEAAELDERARRTGERVAAREVETRQRREQRRIRTDDLRAGLATMAAAYRERLVSDGAGAADAIDAIAAIDAAAEALIRNPNETLWLQALLLRLSPTP